MNFQILKDHNDDARKIAIMVASHNEDTVRFAIEKMNEIGISPEDKVICFGQLLGMCDYITFPLGELTRICVKNIFLKKTLWPI
jgi:proline dehydrogenase